MPESRTAPVPAGEHPDRRGEQVARYRDACERVLAETTLAYVRTGPRGAREGGADIVTTSAQAREK